MKVKYWIETGFVGCDIYGEIEVDDDMDDDFIDDLVRDEMFNHISWGWEKEEIEYEDDDEY